MTSVTIVGGGIVGLATARRLVADGYDVTVVEKETAVARHQTGNNSGVVHAGPYYRPGSLKATMCTAGNRSILRYAAERGIAHDKCGKLIIATDASELSRLDALHGRAVANGVPVKYLPADEVHEWEPHVAAVRALRVESTAIIDYVGVSEAFAAEAREGGAQILLGHRVRAIASRPDGVTVEHDGGSVRSDWLINCAGLYSDRIARMAGLVPEARIVPFRGEYYELRADRRDLVRGLIYPVPDPNLPFLGVHLTRMIDGSVHAGPNAVFALAREGYRWRDINLAETFGAATYPGLWAMGRRNLKTGIAEVWRSWSRRRFAESVARLIPEVTTDDLVRAGAGVRAQAIRSDGTLVDDFLIQRGPRQVHVLNAPSPAATGSLEIAAHVAQMLGGAA